MELNKVTTITKKQAKAYTVLALNTLSVAPNDLDIELVYNEIEELMKLYTPRQATQKAEEILKTNKTKWKKIKQEQVF